MKVIGLTGSFGTGKTFVASIFRSLGAKVLDADRLAHEVIKKGMPAYRRIVDIFGEEILDGNGNIRKANLADVVFGDDKKLKLLNRIVHPEVIRSIKQGLKAAGKKDIVVIDAPLLVEANLTGIIDMLIVVKASRKAQVERCMKKFCMAKADVLKRIRAQMPMEKKIKLADFVIDNDGTKSGARRQAVETWKAISRNISLSE